MNKFTKRFMLLGPILAVFTIALLTHALAQDEESEFYCSFVSVVDGDTINVSCETNLPPHRAVTLRVYAIDTPESRKGSGGAKCGKELRLGKSAKAWAKSQFKKGDKVIWSWVPATGKDPRNRTIANVRLSNGKDWATEAIRIGWAVPYDPDKDKSFTKPNWCKVIRAIPNNGSN